MRRFFTMLAAAIAAMLLFAPTALAGSPHFVGTPTVDRDGSSLIVSGKIAGLGNETQVHVEVSAEAACLNPGGNFPDADNKETFTAAGDFPVQNGKALFELTLTATFQPKCSPPMTVVFGDVTITDAEHGLSITLPGPF